MGIYVKAKHYTHVMTLLGIYPTQIYTYANQMHGQVNVDSSLVSVTRNSEQFTMHVFVGYGS